MGRLFQIMGGEVSEHLQVNTREISTKVVIRPNIDVII